MKHIPNFTILVESGKPSTAGKKPMRKGITKRHAEKIQSIIAHAEEENLEWHTREESEMQLPSSNHSVCTSSVYSAAASLQTMYEPRAPVVIHPHSIRQLITRLCKLRLLVLVQH